MDLPVHISQEEYDEYQQLKAGQWTPPQSALRVILQNYVKAREKHLPMKSPHEGIAILAEEGRELWDEVCAWQPDFANRDAMRKEAYHVAAMALAFILEVTGP